MRRYPKYLSCIVCATLLIIITSVTKVVSEPYPGFTLVAASSTVNLYDIDKKIVKTWKFASTIQTAAYLLPDGSVLAPVSGGSQCSYGGNGAHPNGRIQRFDWNGKLVWDYIHCSSTYTGAYDIQPMPDGNVLICVHYSTDGSNKPGRIVEVKPNGATGGTVVWECNVTSKVAVSGYLNSVSYNPTLDQIAVTIQESGHTMAVIDHKTGNVVSKFSITSGRIHGCNWSMDTYIGTNIKIADADATKMRLGNIVFVANGLQKAYEVNPATATATSVKTYSYSFGSNQGGTQRLPNGNTLCTKGYSSTIDELDDSGTKVWTLAASGTAMRVYRYGMKYPGVASLVGTSISPDVTNHLNKSLKITYSRHTGIATLCFNNKRNNAQIRLFSLDGAELLSKQTTQSQFSIDTKNFANGSYIAKVTLAGAELSTMINVIN